MFSKGIKTHTYREGHRKYENEPEEGEIIDDYDLIVSSDEELSMRQRILELEAENEEIEQIAVISRSYVDRTSQSHNHLEIDRAAQVPTDVSSISSTEFVTPQKRKRRKSKERKRKHCHRQYSREHSHQYDQTIRHDSKKIPQNTHSKKAHCKRRQKLFAKKYKKFQADHHFIHKDLNAETLSIESLESSDSSSLPDTSSYNSNFFVSKRKEDSFNKTRYITRDTLRMAVAISPNNCKSPSNKFCLKDRLLKREQVGQSFKNNIYVYGEDSVIRVDNDDDDDVQVIESEPIIQTIDEDSTDSMEEKELRLIALKSAVLKKHMARKIRNAAVAYSPTDFDEMLSSGILRPDNQMDDVDIVDLEAEDSQPACTIVSPEASPKLLMLDEQEESQQMVDCKPVDMDIANSDSEDATIDSWTKDADPSLNKYSTDSYDFSKSIQYGFIVQNLHELPPPPPGVDDYEDMPPAPRYHMLYGGEMRDMDLESENFTESQQIQRNIFSGKRQQVNADAGLTLQTEDCSIKEEVAVEDDDDGEEEEALRALLLSKFQSPKNQRKSVINKDVAAFKDKDQLKINEFSLQQHCIAKPTEIILKEAVKRLKIHSQTDNFKEERDIDMCTRQHIRLNDQPREFSEKNNDNVFEKLRDRLSLYTNLSHINTNASQASANNLLSEPYELDVNSYNEANVEKHLKSGCGEVTNAIDISDITRRLQIIKENVLNSIPKVIENTHVSNDSFEVSENAPELNESSMESACQLDKPITNHVVHNAATCKDFNTRATKKTVEANFDVHSNETTFKITIKNNGALESEKDDIADTLVDVVQKECANKETKNLPLKDKEIASKAPLGKERSVKPSCKAKKSNAQSTKPVLAPKSAMDYKVTSHTKYSLLRATKIVKPNKVINNNFNINQKQVAKPTEFSLVAKPLQTETNNKITTVCDSPRLITSVDQVKHMCKVAPFIISLKNSSNESSEDEVCEDYSSLYKPLYDYNDNASPLSLNLESPSITPLRSNSPIDSSAEGVVANSNFEVFNSKTKETPKKSIVQASESDNTNKTPLAVRHLPAAAQTEYRKLVHRMKLLENKRKSASNEGNKKENISIEQNSLSVPPLAENTDKEKNKSDATEHALKNSLVKKVLIKNANSSTTLSAVAATSGNHVMQNKTSKVHKSNVLRSYENLYVKFGAGIVNNLDKSLKLVEEAKKAKIVKIKLETRLKELKAEMDILQNKQREEQQKISRIYPSICSTNELIVSLKQKRSKVYKAALSLGKTVKGDIYRLNNDLKETITTKTKKLATEIKTVNSLKAQDIKNNDEDQQIEETKKLNMENCIKNSEENNREIEAHHNNVANSEMDCSKTCKEPGQESTPELAAKTDICGNTEFQNLGTNISKSCENTEDSCRLNPNAKLIKTSSELDSKTTTPLPSYISPLEHLRNIDRNADPNGVVCPYDLMGNCEDVSCKYIHLSPKAKT